MFFSRALRNSQSGFMWGENFDKDRTVLQKMRRERGKYVEFATSFLNKLKTKSERVHRINDPGLVVERPWQPGTAKEMLDRACREAEIKVERSTVVSNPMRLNLTCYSGYRSSMCSTCGSGCHVRCNDELCILWKCPILCRSDLTVHVSIQSQNWASALYVVVGKRGLVACSEDLPSLLQPYKVAIPPSSEPTLWMLGVPLSYYLGSLFEVSTPPQIMGT